MFQSFDLYAKPVTLTYNQQRNFPTVNGAILTVLSAFLLIYYFSVNVVQYVFFQNYTHTTSKSTFTRDDETQDLFTIEPNQMQILTNLTSSDQDIFDNIEQYVGGIYVQMVYNVTNQDTNYTYFKAVDCDKNDPNYDES